MATSILGPLAERAPVENSWIYAALAKPFDPAVVCFHPAVVSGNRALAMAYVEESVIRERLNDVLGAAGWKVEYEGLPEGAVVCRLRVRIGEEWIMKMDVGRQRGQLDEGHQGREVNCEPLRRAAAKFGIGRYLFRLPAQWVEYDPRKQQFVRPPTVPAAKAPQPRRVAVRQSTDKRSFETPGGKRGHLGKDVA